MVFGLEGHKGCKVAANIIHGFDCTFLQCTSWPASIKVEFEDYVTTCSKIFFRFNVLDNV